MHCNNGLNNKIVESLVENKVAQETGDLKYLQDSMYDFVSTLKEIILGEYSPEFFNKYVDEALKLHGSNLEEFLKIPKMGLELRQALESIDDAIDISNQEFRDNLVLLLDRFQTTLDNIEYEARSPYDVAVKHGFKGTEAEWIADILNDSELLRKLRDGVDQLDQALINQGFVTVDSFELGATITQRNQALRHAANGKLYRWAGDLPKDVPSFSTPTSSGGMGDNAWLEVSDVTLRQALTNPNMGVAMVARGVVSVDSIADLMSLPEGQMKEGLRYLMKGYYAGSNVGGGEFVWRAGDMSSKVSSDPFHGLFVPPSYDPSGVSGAWERVVANATIQATWFGTIPDNQDVALSNTNRLQSAIDLTPDSWTLSLSGIGFTWLDTVPNPVGPSSLALYINHPMTLSGGTDHTLKIIPHSSAWEATGSNSHTMMRITSSDVTVEDTNLNPNSTHHYSMHEGFKYWHHNPANKYLRSHAGISVTGSASLVSNVIIRRNIITNCSGGVSATGYYNSLANSWDRDSGLPDKGVYNLQIYENRIVQSRGNGISFMGSVIGAVARDNILEDCMYHPLRMYSGATDCHFISNKIYVDYDAIASRWNQEDLGYWISDNPDFYIYKIQRSSILIGPGQSDAPNINCSACDNLYYFAPGMVTDIYDNINNNSGLQIANYNESIIYQNNRIYNCPGIGISAASFQQNNSYEIKNNTLVNNVGIGMLLRDSPRAARVTGNTFIDCAGESNTREYQIYNRTVLLATYNLDNCVVEDNHFLTTQEKQVDMFAHIAYGTAENRSILLRGNTFSGYTALEAEYKRIGKVSNTIYGDLFKTGVSSDTGWSGFSGRPSAQYLISSGGTVFLGVEGTADNATSDVIVTLPENIRPAYEVVVTGWNHQDGSTHYATISPDTGEVKVIVPEGSSRPSRLQFTVTYMPRSPSLSMKKWVGEATPQI